MNDTRFFVAQSIFLNVDRESLRAESVIHLERVCKNPFLINGDISITSFPEITMPDQSAPEISGALQSESNTPGAASSRQRLSKQAPLRQQNAAPTGEGIPTARQGSHLSPNASPRGHNSPATVGPSRLVPVLPPPERITSMRPPEDPRAAPNMTSDEANVLCNQIVSRIYREDIGHMWEKAREADRRGNVDDKVYTNLLDFFYCFVPMVTKSPPNDPIIFRGTDLQNHRRILNTFGSGRSISQESGPNDPHQWFSKPGPRSLIEEFIDSL
jgi:hypothetical protein